MSRRPDHIHLFLPDTWHFHRRNFAALFQVARREGYSVTINRKRKAWWKLHGHYDTMAEALASHRAGLEGLSPDALAALRHHGVDVFGCARGEILCAALPLPRWQLGPVPGDDDRVLIHRLLDDEADLLLWNMAAAMSWIDFWLLELPESVTHACTFSGSYIYTRTLMEVCRQRGIRSFVLEYLFTGKHYYCEERTDPIPNNSDLRFDNVRDMISLPRDPADLAAMIAQAHRILAEAKSKNVDPEGEVDPGLFTNGRPVALIIGQVVNDFSLIETVQPNIAGIDWYRQIITALLETTDWNIVFKTHPWERRRPNVLGPVTAQALTAFLAGLPVQMQRRVAIIEKPSITSAFRLSNWVLSLCSQGGLEAVRHGFKPIMFGRPFFGGLGFTNDFATVDEFVAAHARGEVAPRVGLTEYRAFETFSAKMLVRAAVTNDPLGVEKLHRRFSAPHALVALSQDLPTVVESPLVRRLRLLRERWNWMMFAARSSGWAFCRDRLHTLRRRARRLWGWKHCAPY